jgi:cell volume regulation protein A
MNDPAIVAILVVAALVAISIFSSVLSFRMGAPLLLVFLGIGLLAGEDGIGGIVFDDAGVAYWVGSLALAMILFDSGFATAWRTYKVAAAPALTLSTLGTVLTAVVVSLAAYLILPIGWLPAMLLGACISSTDAAAVFFLLRAGGMRIRERVRSIVEIESGTNDPIAIFLTLAILDLAISIDGQNVDLSLLSTLFAQFGLGIVLGLGGGFALVRLTNALDIETALYPIVVLAMAMCVFAGTSLVGGSGFVAVYLAGLVAGNRPLKGKYSMRRFQAGLTWLAQIMMFVALGLFATPSEFPQVLLPAILLAVILTVVARPLAVFVCLWPFKLPVQESAFVSWVGLRGAVSILLAILPLRAGLEDGQTIFNVVFLMVIFSLLIQGWTVRLAALRLKLVDSPSGGMVDRMELELPGRAAHELVGYRLSGKSPALRGLRIPRWARPSLVIRHGESLRPHQAGDLLEGDLVYLFCAERHVRLLDRIYVGKDSGDSRDFLGDFSLPPDTSIDSVAARFGIPVPPDLMGKTLREAFASRLRGGAELGDRIPLGPFELIVRDLGNDGHLEEIGLLLDDPDLVRR